MLFEILFEWQPGQIIQILIPMDSQLTIHGIKPLFRFIKHPWLEVFVSHETGQEESPPGTLQLL